MGTEEGTPEAESGTSMLAPQQAVGVLKEEQELKQQVSRATLVENYVEDGKGAKKGDMPQETSDRDTAFGLATEVLNDQQAKEEARQNLSHELRKTLVENYVGTSESDLKTIGVGAPITDANDPGLSPPGLMRNSNPRSASRPGAFSVELSGTISQEIERQVPEVDAMSGIPFEEPDGLLAVEADNGLAVAEPVAGEDTDMEDARPVDPAALNQRSKDDKRRFWGLIACLGLAALVIFLIIFFVVKEGDGDSGKSETKTQITQTPTPPPTLSPEAHLYSILPNYTIPNLQFSETPQGQAFQWLLDDPNFMEYNDKRLQQRFALATIYYSTFGERWNPNWLNYSRHECDWTYYMPYGEWYNNGPGHIAVDYKFIDGLCHILDSDNTTAVSFYTNVTTNESNTTSLPVADDITCLAFFERQLEGQVPLEIKMLSSLKMVLLEGNALDGPIPLVLAELTGLHELRLEDSAFHGTIPKEISRLSDLRVLEISGLGITGTLPSQLALLTDMRDLMIAETSVSGTIPTEYGLLSPRDLHLYRNQLTGTIPTEFGLSGAARLMVERNQLNGTIPTELGLMENMFLLYVQENQLSGTVPTELGLLPILKQLYVNVNMLTGRIPTELGNANDTVWRLKFDENFITGTVPSELGKLTKMHSLGVDTNILTGTIPRELGEIPAMQYLQFHDNQFTGSVVDIFWNSTKMVKFQATNNQFTGTISTEIGSWEKVQNFEMANNQLVGSIPSEVGLLRKLRQFELGFNSLTGTIATELGLLVTNSTSLKLFNITNNEGFSGEVPEDLCILEDPSGTLYTAFYWDCTENLCGCNCSCSDVSSPMSQEDGTLPTVSNATFVLVSGNGTSALQAKTAP